jgi:S-DNA-T family DNA segregation ATPase FtsK/SpoIIIE
MSEIDLSKPRDPAPTVVVPPPEDPPPETKILDASPGVVVDTEDDGPTKYAKVVGWVDAPARPIIPAWIKDKSERNQVAYLVARRSVHSSAFHTVRSPIYALRAVLFSPRGLVRVIRAARAAWFDGSATPLRQLAIQKGDPETFLKLRRDQDKIVRRRSPLAIALMLAACAVLTLIWRGFVTEPPPVNPATQPSWWTIHPEVFSWALLILVVAVLGRIGQPADKPLVTGATVLEGLAPKPTSELIVNSLRNLGVAGLTETTNKPRPIQFPHPIRTDGPGWRADIDLPQGVTALDVIDKRTALASGLRRPVGCVWPEADPEVHAGRLVLWVGMQDMAKARPAPHPLRKSGTADYFKPLPFLTDQRHRPIGMTLAETNVLIGSLPGAGKTAAVRCILAAAALDVTTELHVWELKGSGDLESFERIAYAYGSGVDDATIGSCCAELRWLLAELERRSEKLKALRQRNRDLVPDSKVTRDLANRKGFGLHPIVFVVDEAQELFSHPEYGKLAGDLATRIIKRGRALGVTLVLATQRPDKESLPTGVSANVGTRFCLRVMGQIENDMILGTSAYRMGIRATTFTRSDRGIGYLVGAEDQPVVGRTYYLDAAATDSIVSRAFTLREESNWLTGAAANEQPASSVDFDLLSDIRRVFGMAERIHTTVLLDGLGNLRPQLYGDWTPETLAAALKPHGVTPRPTRVGEQVLKGYALEHVLEAMTKRELERGDDGL